MNSQELINLVMGYFDTWSYKKDDYKCPLVILDKDKYLEDYLSDEKLIWKDDKNEFFKYCGKRYIR